jgi:UDP-N-acetyl-D-glucosamine dehydrogenase
MHTSISEIRLLWEGVHRNPHKRVRILTVTAQESRILAIIGQGYVGLPLAMAAIEAGWTVIGVDNLVSKVAQINSGSSPVEDISNERLQSALLSGMYKATSDFSAISKASVITICVPTPLDVERKPDLDILINAATRIAPFISDETLVLSESTSYPGTLRNIIIPTIKSYKSPKSTTIYFASAPERVNPGDSVWNQRNTPRLVGGIDHDSQKRAIAFYESFCEAVVAVSTPEIAEAAKLLENSFRLVNIALVNEFTQLCSANEINAYEVIEAAATKPYGFMPFWPGVGVGGHCIPVDPLYLTWWARHHGGIARVVEIADETNQSMPRYVAQRAISMLNSSKIKPKVLIVGIAYKSGLSDVRETPASSLRNHLISFGAEVAWYDPMVSFWDGTEPVNLDWECDVAIVATLQPGMDLAQLTGRSVKILDCTNSIENLVGVVKL